MAQRLVRTAMAAVVPEKRHAAPDHIQFPPPDWHDHPEVVRAVDDRRSVLDSLGARPLVERLRLQWDARAVPCRRLPIGCASGPWPTPRSSSV